MNYETYIDHHLKELKEIADQLDRESIKNSLAVLEGVRNNKGRLFILGIGGSAANASHAVNDFRKISGIESYTPVDNVAELTAWTNDVGFEVIFSEWLKTSHLGPNDALLIFSVGGGTETTSKNLVLAMQYAKEVGAKILGIVSRDGGMTKKLADVTIHIPVVNDDRITPHAEEWQGIVWHILANALALTKDN